MEDADTPLHAAETPEAAAALLDAGADPDARGWMGRTPLHAAAGDGRAGVVRLLLARGADPNAVRPERLDTPLHFAANGECAAALLASGASPGAADGFGRTPLHWAASNDRGHVLAVLLAAGAPVDPRNEWRETPLHEAAREGADAAVAALLAAGADPNAVARFGRTPLHHAATRGQCGAIRILLAAGSDPAARNSGGQTPGDEAVEGTHVAAAGLLEG